MQEMVKGAEAFGLPKHDVNNALEMTKDRDYDIAFDIIVQQLYEHGIEINDEYFSIITKLAYILSIKKSEYGFVEKLIRRPFEVPQELKYVLASILQTLKNNNIK